MAYLQSFQGKKKKQKKPFASTGLGIAVNTVLGLPKAFKKVSKDANEFVKEARQDTARSIGSAGVTLAKKIGGSDKVQASDIRSPFGQKLFRATFGNKPIKALEDRIAKAEIDIKENPFAKKIGLDKQALPLAFIGIMGSTTLDLTPFGGLEKNVVKKLVKETTREGALKILKSMKVEDETAEIFAKNFAAAKTPKEVKDVLGAMKATMPVEALKKAIESSKPLRGEVENLQKIERAKRFATAYEAQQKVGGQEGYFQGLSKLKGELLEKPPTFTPAKDALIPEKIDELFSIVQKNNMLNFGEQLTAQKGLKKLLDGHVPVPSELKVLEEVFGSDVVRAVFARRPLSQKIWDVAGEVVADIPRALQTTLDMSATLRQSIMLGLRNPKTFAKSFGKSFRSMISNNYFEKALDEMAVLPEFRVAKDSGLRLSDPRKLFGQREEYFLSNLAEKIPVIGPIVKASNRGYVGMVNTMRFNVFNDLAKSMTITDQASAKNLKALADFVNTATGSGSLGSLERSAGLLSKVFYAPRFVMSRVQWMNPFWYAKQPKPVRMEALKTMGTFVGTVTSIITLAKMGGADVETNWKSSNFGKMKVGNTYYDLTFGFGQYIRLFGQLASNEKKTNSGKIEKLGGEGPYDENRLEILERVVRGKLAPAWSATLNLISGENVVGEKVTPKSQLMDSVIPFYIQDLNEAIEDRGWDALLTVGLPGFFGVGTQTYQEKNTRLKSFKTGDTKKKNYLDSFKN